MQNTTKSNATKTNGIIDVLRKIGKAKIYRSLGIAEVLIIAAVIVFLFRFL